ncbi:MAG: SDR family oxidoreductase [Actinomycetota bacterium]|nr:SDR family oxidoreductase [Actinomycetota bacterium]
MPRLEGRIVIVTGATSGIGRAICERCAQEGALVVANGRRQTALEELEAGHRDHLVPHPADLAEPGECERLVARACELGELRGVVHAAGTVRRGEDPRSTTAAEFEAFMRTNLTPAFELTSAACAAMSDGAGGSIVLLGSQLAHVGIPGYETYTAAKGGVTAMARAFAAEAGPYGVRVNVLAPGVVQTPMAYVDREDFDELIPGIAARHPLRRIGVPKDLAGPAVFLLSDDAAWVTGHTLIVDGGFTAV